MVIIVVKILLFLFSMLCAYIAGQGSRGKDSLDEVITYICIIASLVIGLIAVFL